MRTLSLVTFSFLVCLTGFALADGAPGDVASGIASGQENAMVRTVPAEGFFDENFNDLQQELAIAREEGKSGLLIMFEMDECPFCRRMKQTVLNRSDVQEYFHRHFRIISVDTEGDVEMVDFDGNATTEKAFALKQFRVRGTPVFLFVDVNGKPIKNGRLSGATKNADEFLLLGKFIVEGHYEHSSFSRFKRSNAQSGADSGAS